MNDETETLLESSDALTACAVAPEDIGRGDYLCVLHELHEFLPVGCLLEANHRPPELVRLLWLPSSDNTPLKVLEVCLPFVLVRKADGKHRTLDVRRYRLARVTARFAKKVLKRRRRDKAKSGNLSALLGLDDDE